MISFALEVSVRNDVGLRQAGASVYEATGLRQLAFSP
jgi:hypothetical protein